MRMSSVVAGAPIVRPVSGTLKRVLVGKPIPSSEAEHQRLSKKIALPVFSSDAISSTAYATGEILAVTAIGGSSLALGIAKMVPIAVVVAVLLVIVVISYRQTIFAYPNGGGSYIVSRENLGEYPSILAAASLLIDYILTVAVSISAGVEAIISLDQGLDTYRVEICLGFIAVMTIANLRGLKESGAVFAPPTYLYVTMVTLLLVVAMVKGFGGSLQQVVFDEKLADEKMINQVGGHLSIFILLKGFSSGAVALTGVEAISNGVPAFKKPEARNASNTMVWMGIILGTLFFGTALLASRVSPYPSSKKTAVAQMGEAVFGKGFLLFALQISTCAILTLAANTAYADFPRLAQLIARDGYLPRQFANFGDRLVFSNGVIVLGVASSALIIGFGGITTALIPLYAVGVFTAFTLSQFGMVRHHRKVREPNWRVGAVINAIGAVSTFVVLIIVASTKFTSGAWIPIVIVPPLMFLFISIKRHYAKVSAALAVAPELVRKSTTNNTVIVLVGRLHRGVLKAISYAQSLRPQHLVAVYVASNDDERIAMERQWEQFGITIPLEIVHSPYRQLVEPIERYIDELDRRWDNDTVTVVIPEFIVETWYQNILHNQTALRLKGTLLYREGVVVTSVPYHLDSDDTKAYIEVMKERGLAPGAVMRDASHSHDTNDAH